MKASQDIQDSTSTHTRRNVIQREEERQHQSLYVVKNKVHGKNKLNKSQKESMLPNVVSQQISYSNRGGRKDGTIKQQIRINHRNWSILTDNLSAFVFHSPLKRQRVGY